MRCGRTTDSHVNAHRPGTSGLDCAVPVSFVSRFPFPNHLCRYSLLVATSRLILSSLGLLVHCQWASPSPSGEKRERASVLHGESPQPAAQLCSHIEHRRRSTGFHSYANFSNRVYLGRHCHADVRARLVHLLSPTHCHNTTYNYRTAVLPTSKMFKVHSTVYCSTGSWLPLLHIRAYRLKMFHVLQV
jgi:hypothetical protein